MPMELWDEAAAEPIDNEIDDQLDLLDELEVDDEFETWCTIRPHLPSDLEIGD